MTTIEISSFEASKILSTDESHFVEIKSIGISPARLTKTISAFSNTDGGELYVGIEEDKKTSTKKWCGFEDQEKANGHLQAFEEFFPLDQYYTYYFLSCKEHDGIVLKVEVAKTPNVKFDSKGIAFIRRGAQSLPVDGAEGLDRLKRNKGITSFETEVVNADPAFITNSETVIKFMVEVIPTAEPEAWLSKQQLLKEQRPSVAGVILFADEPQALLPKRSGVKISRYKTTNAVGTRETLDSNPISIEGDAYNIIYKSVAKTVEIVEKVRIHTNQGLQKVTYPPAAIHEIITNAVLHRDYSIADDIHIYIFDNRVEVLSPGTLPAHITADNILDQRYSRNASIVRLINKFPDPPNKDMGEGLNTAFEEMRKLHLKEPEILVKEGYVSVILKHERLAAPEELILEYLQSHEQIRNRDAREICHIGSENKMKGILQKMVKNDLLELVPGTTRYTAAYQLKGEEQMPGLFSD